MRLSDIMSNMHLSGYAEVALLIFLGVFLVIVRQTFKRSNQEKWNAEKLLPLEEEPVAHTQKSGARVP